MVERLEAFLTQNVRHFPRDWMAKRGIEWIDAGTLLTRLADDCPYILREAYRLGVSSRPQTSAQVLAILERDTNKDVAAIVRAIVEPEAQSESADRPAHGANV